MTFEEFEEAQEWVKLENWTWCAGMVDEDKNRILREGHMANIAQQHNLPDLKDAATRGCLIDITRKLAGATTTAVPVSTFIPGIDVVVTSWRIDCWLGEFQADSETGAYLEVCKAYENKCRTEGKPGISRKEET